MASLLVRTRLGWFWAVSRDGKLTAASLTTDRASGAAAIAAAGAAGPPDELLERLAGDMGRYAAGERMDFSHYPVDLSGEPPFWRRAQLAARRIPHGQVRSYGWLAAQAGNAKSARAAGQAMAHNRIAPIIPCHRVIASDRTLGGYGGGLAVKRELLELEGVGFEGARVRG
jgi:methylated-DNA-[protein]-cysteine S-methyltransferase